VVVVGRVVRQINALNNLGRTFNRPIIIGGTSLLTAKDFMYEVRRAWHADKQRQPLCVSLCASVCLCVSLWRL
jgi:hypothetical protein